MLLDAISATAFVLCLSIGLFVTYSVGRVINMSHGEMIMIGAYVTAIMSGCGTPYAISLAVAAAVCALAGLLIERACLRRLHARKDLSTLLATWGVGAVLAEAVRILFGPAGRFVDSPWPGSLNVVGQSIPKQSLVMCIGALAMIVLLQMALARSKQGLFARATADDESSAELFGINTSKYRMLSFAVGSALAGVAGGLIAPTTSVTPYMGAEYSYLCFIVVILGGRGSLLGLFLAAVLVGGGKSILNSMFGTIPSTLAMLGAVLSVLCVRPGGLIAASGRRS